MSLIPAHTLSASNRVLFIAHLAIGDFAYLQNFFSAFAKAHPHLQIDLWIDEVRCTANPIKWEALKKYSLYDWVEQCGLFAKVYRRTYSPALRQESIREAQQEHYPIVISLATLRPHQYARLAREIAPQAFVVGIKKRARWFAPWEASAYTNLDASFSPYAKREQGYHISDVYADWFEQLSGLQVKKEKRLPFVHIPQQWQGYAQYQLQQWNVTDQKIVFINAYAKTQKRCWPLTRVVELIHLMRKLPAWKECFFIVNAVPQEIDNAKRILATYQLKNTQLFSAEENFFQLPAILARCDLIISVETAVMHLANAVHVPVIALMRQKNPEWVPIDQKNSTVITTPHRRDWVKAITAHQIIEVLPA